MLNHEHYEKIQRQQTCSHDAPGQEPGKPCLRCEKVLPGEPPPAVKTVESEDPVPTPTTRVPFFGSK